MAKLEIHFKGLCVGSTRCKHIPALCCLRLIRGTASVNKLERVSQTSFFPFFAFACFYHLPSFLPFEFVCLCLLLLLSLLTSQSRKFTLYSASLTFQVLFPPLFVFLHGVAATNRLIQVEIERCTLDIDNHRSMCESRSRVSSADLRKKKNFAIEYLFTTHSAIRRILFPRRFLKQFYLK
jgi:hypothetical protein